MPLSRVFRVSTQILWEVQISYPKYKLNVVALGQRIFWGKGEEILSEFCC